MKFPFGGLYEYAKNSKTVISFLVIFFFSSTATQVFKDLCLQRTCIPWDNEKFRVQLSRSFSKLSQTLSTLLAEHLDLPYDPDECLLEFQDLSRINHKVHA